MLKIQEYLLSFFNRVPAKQWIKDGIYRFLEVFN